MSALQPFPEDPAAPAVRPTPERWVWAAVKRTFFGRREIVLHYPGPTAAEAIADLLHDAGYPVPDGTAPPPTP